MRIGQDDLQEKSHPRLERLFKSSLNKLIVSTISPSDQPDQLVEQVENLLSTLNTNFLLRKGFEKAWECDWHHVVHWARQIAVFFVHGFEHESEDTQSEVDHLKFVSEKKVNIG